MPLLYYDEIKDRNSVVKPDQLPQLPFFLDFKNLSEEQEKIQSQMKGEIMEKKNKLREAIDKNLSNDLHEIILHE